MTPKRSVARLPGRGGFGLLSNSFQSKMAIRTNANFRDNGTKKSRRMKHGRSRNRENGISKRHKYNLQHSWQQRPVRELDVRNINGQKMENVSRDGVYVGDPQHFECRSETFPTPYADPIIDPCTGKIAAERLRSAFMQVAEASGTSFNKKESKNMTQLRSSDERTIGTSVSRLRDTIASKRARFDFCEVSERNETREERQLLPLGNMSECSDVSDDSDDDSMEDGEVVDSAAECLVEGGCAGLKTENNDKQDGTKDAILLLKHIFKEKVEEKSEEGTFIVNGEVGFESVAEGEINARPSGSVVDPRLKNRKRGANFAAGCTTNAGDLESENNLSESGVDIFEKNETSISFRNFTFHEGMKDETAIPLQFVGSCVSRGKLPLLLDLDNTLLNAQAVNTLNGEIDLKDWLDEQGKPMLYRFELPCNRKAYYMKLRPFVREFLSLLEPYYEMSIYTNATQEYADLVVAILDPERTVFEDRIVARTSSQRNDSSEFKSVSRLYGGLDRGCVVAFDDRQNIWMDLPHTHVVKAQHYDFFDSNKAELNSYYSKLPKERMRSLDMPKDYDRHLEFMVKVFLKIHEEYFKKAGGTNVGEIVVSMQQSILGNIGVFLTGYRKTYFPSVAVCDLEERQSELTMRLGGKVHRRFDENGVTHVVAGKNNTNNMLACKDEKYRHLIKVHTLWLYACEAMWSIAPTEPFEAEKLCSFYDNLPPSLHFRDHWVHLGRIFPIPKSLEMSLPEFDSRPVKEFLATGPYTDGATLSSPFEEIVFMWMPEKQSLKQVFGDEHTMDFTNQRLGSRILSGEIVVSAQKKSESTKRGVYNSEQSKSNVLEDVSEGGNGVTNNENKNGEVDFIPFCNHQVYAT